MNTASPHEIEDYLRSKGLRIRRRGDKAECDICPFCGGGDSIDKRTFVVFLDQEGGNYKCMRGSCAVSGSLWQLCEHFGDDPKQFYKPDGNGYKSYKRPVEAVEVKPKFVPPPRETQFTYNAEQFQLLDFTPEALEYLYRREFSDECLASVQIGCNPQGEICFVYYHKGEVCFVKVRQPVVARGSDRAMRAAWSGGLRVLWGLEECDSWDTLVITFGEYDRMAVRQAGVLNVVSVPGGDSDLEWINTCWHDLERFKTIILWADNDPSGDKCLPIVASRLGEHRIRVVRTEYKDANDMLVRLAREKGREGAQDAIYEAVQASQWYVTDSLVHVVDILPKEQDFRGYLTGFTFLNRALHGFLRGQLTVHTGDSKAGKSTALTQISAACIAQGATVCAWSGEDDNDTYKYRMDVHLGGYIGTEVKVSRAGREYAVLRPEYQVPVNDFIRNRLYLLNQRFGVTEDNLVENFELAFRRYGCDVFIVDNLMKMVASKDTTQIFFRQAQIINRLSDFAKDFGVHVHIATHVNKGGIDVEPPTKNSVSGAKEITNLADNVISWWRVPDGAKEQFQGADAVCSVLANRMFGDEPMCNLRYDWRVKRFGETVDDLHMEYVKL
jgi:hypothetical protein